MKKLITAAVLAAAVTTASAHGHSGHAYGWVAPAVIGGALGYGISRYYAPPPVYPPPSVYYPPAPMPQYVQPQLYPVQVWNPYCNCWTIQYRPYP